jgi:hypothetical protein
MIKVIILSAGLLVGLLLLGWIGLSVTPPSFAVTPPQAAKGETIRLPQNLPTPVERFYRQLYGEQIPVIQTAILSGRGWMRPLGLGGLTFPMRFRFTHTAGQAYRHYIELTFFGLPLLKVNEYYVNGKERMVMPWGMEEHNPKLDQAGNLGMWAEALEWFPALLLTDPRVQWEPIDEVTALLVVPFGATQERFVVRFDPASGQVQSWEGMRYRNGSGEKLLWINGAWFDMGVPWVNFKVEEMVFNAQVDTSFAAQGP